MPRPPPVTLTMTWGARRTVASMRLRIAMARLVPQRKARRLRLDDPVARVEEAIAPFDEDAVERGSELMVGFREAGSAESPTHALPLRSDMSSARTAAASSRCLRTSPSRLSRRPGTRGRRRRSPGAGAASDG